MKSSLCFRPVSAHLPNWRALVLAGLGGLLLLASTACSRAEKDAQVEKEAAIAAVQLDDMLLLRADGPNTPSEFRTAALHGAPYWLVVLRAMDPVATEGFADWTALAKDLQTQAAGALVVLLTGTDADVLAQLEAWGAADTPAPFPVVRANEAILGALARKMELRASPTSFLFDAQGRLLRTVAGYPPNEHFLEDALAAAAGQPLPEHPAQGVLPEDNTP